MTDDELLRPSLGILGFRVDIRLNHPQTRYEHDKHSYPLIDEYTMKDPILLLIPHMPIWPNTHFNHLHHVNALAWAERSYEEETSESIMSNLVLLAGSVHHHHPNLYLISRKIGSVLELLNVSNKLEESYHTDMKI